MFALPARPRVSPDRIQAPDQAEVLALGQVSVSEQAEVSDQVPVSHQAGDSGQAPVSDRAQGEGLPNEPALTS